MDQPDLMRRLSLLLAVTGLSCGKPAPAAEPAAPPRQSPTDNEDEEEDVQPAPSVALTPDVPPSPPEVPGGGPDPLALDGTASTSIGTPTTGHLTASVPLPLHGPGFEFNPRKDPARRHGTFELVRGVMLAAAEVHELHPGGTLTVGDLSMPNGGDIAGHASHRAGRDVDVMFYLQHEDGRSFPAKAIPIEPDGTGVDYKDLTTAKDDVHVKIDVPRTWAFVAALVGDDRNRIARIYIVEHLRTLLLEEGKRVGASAALLELVGHVTCQPKFPHDDHMHIRFFCSPDDIGQGCRDTGPVYPWQTAFLKDHGTSMAVAKTKRKPRPKLTSVEDAAKRAREEAAAPFDPAVDAFLERRKAWAKKPRARRLYCR